MFQVSSRLSKALGARIDRPIWEFMLGSTWLQYDCPPTPKPRRRTSGTDRPEGVQFHILESTVSSSRGLHGAYRAPFKGAFKGLV